MCSHPYLRRVVNHPARCIYCDQVVAVPADPLRQRDILDDLPEPAPAGLECTQADMDAVRALFAAEQAPPTSPDLEAWATWKSAIAAYLRAAGL